jgi:hypothetical protein
MYNLMIDLETMSTSSNAAIIAIGACFFDENKIYDSKFYEKVSIQSCIDKGFDIDGATVLWWMKQSDSARKEFAREENQLPINMCLLAFSNFIVNFFIENNQEFSKGKLVVWGNGSVFDNVVLKNAYQKCKIELPWIYKNDRCFRTLKNLFPMVEKPEDIEKHNAYYDALWQAKYAQLIFSYMGSKDINIDKLF